MRGLQHWRRSWRRRGQRLCVVRRDNLNLQRDVHWLGNNDAHHFFLVTKFDLIVRQFFIVVLVLHPTTRKLQTMKQRPPCSYPEAYSFQCFFEFLMPLLLERLQFLVLYAFLNSTSTLPARHLFLSRMPYCDKRSRAKNTEERNK